MSKVGILEADYQDAAKIIGCEVACIKAVDTIESEGCGFLNTGQIKILFEPHIFYQRLKMHGINPIINMRGNEDILYPVWKPGAYGPMSAQWGRMERAKKIHEVAALESASYGRYQCMGFNFAHCKFGDVKQFVTYLSEDEQNQLMAFVTYVKDVHLDDELKAKLWDAFAEGYNGPAYKKNNYAGKLLAAYNKAK